jgi:hypothetical protein
MRSRGARRGGGGGADEPERAPPASRWRAAGFCLALLATLLAHAAIDELRVRRSGGTALTPASASPVALASGPAPRATAVERARGAAGGAAPSGAAAGVAAAAASVAAPAPKRVGACSLLLSLRFPPLGGDAAAALFAAGAAGRRERVRARRAACAEHAPLTP